MTLPPTVRDVQLKMINLLHKGVLKASGGRFGGNLGGMAALELHTIGRKSGQRRSVMLTAPIHEPDRIVLVASKGGDDRHPDWYRNLDAHPDVEITEAGVTRPMHARTASPEEKAVLWPAIVARYKNYAGYQTRTARDIPVVICEPRS
jgi:deazaflavin-dependent oxidoreductase (nitroreductase family)